MTVGPAHIGGTDLPAGTRALDSQPDTCLLEQRPGHLLRVEPFDARKPISSSIHRASFAAVVIGCNHFLRIRQLAELHANRALAVNEDTPSKEA